MAVTVKKLEGDDIPEQFRDKKVLQVFEVLDAEGHSHFREDEVEAARLAVELSDKTKGND